MSILHSLKPKLFTALTLSVAVFISGCTATGSGFLGESADPRLTTGQNTEHFKRKTLLACATGASVGVVGCLLSGTNNQAACMIIAAIAGCGIGAGTTAYLDSRRAEYSNTNERLQAMTNDVQADTQVLMARTQVFKEVIRDDEIHMRQLKKQLESKKIDAEKAQKELKKIDSNISVMNKEMTDINERINQYQEVSNKERADGASAQSISTLNTEIEKLKKEKATIENILVSHTNARNAIRLG